MKIIFLNPKIDAGHKIARALQSRGLGLLFAADADELWQMLELHGSSVDLAMIHLEGETGKIDPQLHLIDKVKSHPEYSDLPMVLTTSSWRDADCVAHQRSPQGVNAYLHFPFSESQLLDVIQTILGVSFEGGVRPDSSLLQISTPIEVSTPVEAPHLPRGGSENSKDDGTSSVILEDLSQVFLKPESESESGADAITLEAPEPDSAESPGLSPEAGIPLAGLEGEHAPVPLPPASQEVVDTFAALEAPAAVDLSPAEGALGSEGIPVGSPPSVDLSLDLQVQTSAPMDESPVDLSAPIQSSPSLPPPVPEDTLDPEAAQAMPYVLPRSKDKTPPPPPVDPAFIFAEPVGDAVVPGGAAQTPDLETFKKYLLLREQDVAILSNQLKAAKEQMALVEQLLRDEKAKNVELTHSTHEQKTKIENFEAEKEVALEGLQTEITELRFQIKAKTDRARVLEKQVLEVSEEMEHLKERVRTDIRKIRVREKELENRLEIVKKDSEALMSARETKITELKRKLDLMEFNMDLLQDQYNREKEVSAQLRERLAKAAQIIRMAGGLLDTPKGMGAQELLSEVLGAQMGKDKAS